MVSDQVYHAFDIVSAKKGVKEVGMVGLGPFPPLIIPKEWYTYSIVHCT